MARKLAFSLFALLMAACATDISQIPVNGKAPSCVSACSKTYSECVGRSIGVRSALEACAGGYRACTNACPAAQ